LGFEADKRLTAPVSGEGEASGEPATAGPPEGPAPAADSLVAEVVDRRDESTEDASLSASEARPVPYSRPAYAAPAGPPPRHFSGESAGPLPPPSGAEPGLEARPVLPPRQALHAAVLPEPEGPEDAVMSLTDHLGELRNRLLACLCGIGGLTLLCLFFSGWIIDWLKATAPSGLRFYTTNPTEAFSVYVKTAAISGLVLSTPLIFYQCWEFIRPGLHTSERQHTRIFVPAFALFFFAGAGFARYVVVPMGVAFLVGFAQGIAEPIYTVGDYTSFVLQLMLICGVLFEFPILLYMMASFGLITTELLRRKRKFVFFWIFVASAGLTPSTDVGTQMAMAIPIVLLFEATIVVLRMRGM
jgi:sec-independent protein translocase protein TatC